MPKRRKTDLNEESSNLSERLYETIYSDTSEFPFTIHSKKLQEAEALFQSAIEAFKIAAKKSLIAVKGPTGCGKGFLYAHIKKNFDHSVHFSEFDEDLHQMPSERSPMDYSFPIQCSTSIFPALQLTPVHHVTSFVTSSCNRVPLLRLTDAHFQVKEVRRVIEELKAFQGILLVEFTESQYDGSNTEFALKLLKEHFADRFLSLNLNPCAPQLMKKALTTSVIGTMLNDFNSIMEQCFTGDARAFLHDLFVASLSPNKSYSFPARDYRTDFFHYIGKVLYPAKEDSKGRKAFDEESFWDDVDLDALFLFVQYYLPKFVVGDGSMAGLSQSLDALSAFDLVSWQIKNNVSLLHHPCNCLTYGTLLSIYWAINEKPQDTNPIHKRSFFSFSKPPTITSHASKRHADEHFILDQLIKR